MKKAFCMLILIAWSCVFLPALLAQTIAETAPEKTPTPASAPGPARLLSIHHESKPEGTNVVLFLSAPARWKSHVLTAPDRLYLDLKNTRLPDEMLGATPIPVNDGVVKQVRWAMKDWATVRVVLELAVAGSEHSAEFSQTEPYRLMITVRRMQSPKTARGEKSRLAPIESAVSEKSPDDALQQPGLVRGTVEDPSGIPVAEAAVKLVSQTNSETLKTVTDEAGHFVFAQVPPGAYRLGVKMQGFEKAELEVKVGADPTPAQRVRLELANVHEEITVSARATSDPLSSDQNATAIVLEHDLLKSLPMKNEEPLSVANLFVDPAANDAEGTKIVVDGVEADTLDVPRDSIKNIAVNKNPYSTEFGRPGRGRIEVTTRPGSLRRFHKRFEFAMRDAALDARNHFTLLSPPRRREWLAGELDGPLFGGKATFVLGGDLLRDNDNAFVTAITQNGPVSDTAPVPRRTGHLFGRTEVRLTPLNLLSVRYSWSVDRFANQGVGGFDLADRGWTSNKRTQELRISEIATPTSSVLNEFVFDFRLRPKLYTSVTDATAILVNGFFNSGGAQVSRRDMEKDVEFQDLVSYLRGKHSLRFGGVVKTRFIDYTDRSNFGGTFTFPSLTSFVSNPLGNPPTPPQPSLYTVNQGDPRVTFTQSEIAYFFQDEIRLWPRLSLLLGLRHELQSNLSDHNNLAPRIALSASTADRRTMLRAGSGIFYQRQPVSLLEQAVLLDGSHLQQFVVQNPSFPSPALLPACTGGLTPPGCQPLSVYRIDPRIRTPYAIQASLDLERKLGNHTTLTADYTMLRGVKLYRMVDLNAPLPATGLRPDPHFVNVDQFESSGTSDSHSLTVGFQTTVRRLQLFSRYTFSHSIDDTSGMTYLPADNFNLRAERGRSDFDQRHRLVIGSILKLPYGLKFGVLSTVRSGFPYNITTGFDDNHDSVFNDRPSLGNPSAPFNSFGVDGQILLQNGFPLCSTPPVPNCVSPGVLYNGTQVVSNTLPLNPVNPNDVHWLVLPGPGNVGRNTGNGPGWADVDVRFTKKFILRKAQSGTETTREIDLRADAFDLLNHTNYRPYVGTLTSPLFGFPNDAYSSRELQLGVRVAF